MANILAKRNRINTDDIISKVNVTGVYNEEIITPPTKITQKKNIINDTDKVCEMYDFFKLSIKLSSSSVEDFNPRLSFE